MKQTRNFEEFTAKIHEEKTHFKNQISITEQALDQKEQLLQEAKKVSVFVSGEDNKARNYRLIQKGVAIESACPDTELMSHSEFYNLADEIFNTDRIRKRIREILDERGRS